MSTLYSSTVETPSVPLAVHVPVSRHVGVLPREKAGDARPATIATAKNPARFAPLLDESRPENAFSAHSLARGRNLLSEGYSISKWSRNARTGEARYFVETPLDHEYPWYVVTFRDGGAECECARVGLGKRTALCCHIAAIVHWDGLYPGLVAAKDYDGDGTVYLTHWGETGYRSVRVKDGAEVAK